MKKLILLLLTFVSMVSLAAADEWVNGYTKRDGTYVPGYYRTNPNGTTSDNYSHKGNINPYTGKEGTQNN